MRCHILASGRHTRYWRYIIDIAGLLTKGYLRVVSGMTRIGTMAPRRRALDKGARLQGALTIPPCGGSNRPTNRQRPVRILYAQDDAEAMAKGRRSATSQATQTLVAWRPAGANMVDKDADYRDR